MVVHLTSPDQRYDTLYMSNYAVLQVRDELVRLDGVGDVQVCGVGDYSLRVWLDPNQVAARELTATDVVNAVREQNGQVAAGTVGAAPAPTASLPGDGEYPRSPDRGSSSATSSSAPAPTAR